VDFGVWGRVNSPNFRVDLILQSVYNFPHKESEYDDT